MVDFPKLGLCSFVIFCFILVDSRFDGCALSNLANGSCFTFLLSLKYDIDGDGSPLDIRWSGGIVDKCKGEYTFPCWRFNVSRQEVDVVTDQFKHFDSLTVDGRRDEVKDYVDSVRGEICPDHALTCNCSNGTTPPGAMNETALPKGPVYISEIVFAVVNVVVFLLGCGATFVIFLIVHLIKKTKKKNTNSSKRERLNGVLRDCLQEVSAFCVLNIPWKCPGRNPCSLTAPVLASYNGASYVFIVFEEKRELDECIGANFCELKKTYQVSDVFGVQVDDLENVLSGEQLYIRHRVSEEWKRSPSKEVGFLPTPEGQSTTPNVDSNSISIPIVDSNNEVIGINLNRIGELNTVLPEPPVQVCYITYICDHVLL
jgi:hypothetical protein